MEKKILLLSEKSKFRTNANSYMNLNFSSKQKLILDADLAETLSLYDLYNSEIDSCDNFRLIIDINAICSNVLFNNVTEIVKNECSDDCEIINSTPKQIFPHIISSNNIDRALAIKDTEFSHEISGNYTYHCGSDIFNNHRLRSNIFSHIGMVNVGKTDKLEYYNTLADYNRDDNGDIITMEKYTSTPGNSEDIDTHVYTTDSLMSMGNSFSMNCIEKDGWFGFENKTSIDIPNVKKGKLYTINRVINNEDPCSFIDMFPGRDRFSFIPEYNKSRNRVETNWDYCLTYPYSSDYDKFNEINGNKYNAVKIISAKTCFSNSGEVLIEFKTLFKHTLYKNSFVTLYYTNSNNPDAELSVIEEKIKVVATGDSEGNDSDKIFKIKFDDVERFFNIIDGRIVTLNNKKCNFFFKKTLSSGKCSYYFRKFKKIVGLDEDGNKVELKSDINKLALAKNIYGDNMAQIIYTDDINLNGLVNNIGLPVTDIYVTIIKANRGHDEWYAGDITNSKIERSYPFGKVTSGIELPESYYDYNIHKLHNIDLSQVDDEYVIGAKALFVNYLTQPKVIEDDITIDNDEFYGDIVEFNPDDYAETVIENIYYRFNTAQRESTNKDFFDVFESKIIYDDYYDKDLEEDKSCEFKTKKPFGFVESGVTPEIGGGNTVINGGLIIQDIINSQKPSATTIDTQLNTVYLTSDGSEAKYPGNLQPEGYYYNPHYRIGLRVLKDELMTADAELINCSKDDVIITNRSFTYAGDNGQEIVDTYDEVKIIVPMSYGFKQGETIIFYDVLKEKTIFGVIEKFTMEDKIVTLGDGTTGTVVEMAVTATFESGAIKREKVDAYNYVISYVKESAPTYSKYSIARQQLIWRDVVNASEIAHDSTLYNSTYSNGAFYMHKNINLYLKRQDPNGDYFMATPESDYRGVNGVPVKMKPFRKMGYGKLIVDIIKFLESQQQNTNCL